MSPEYRIPENCREEVPRELIDLGRLIAALPEEEFDQLEASYAQVVDCVKRRRRILALVQEALSQLRLDIKYLMFDLEITRQERDELREQLDRIERDDFGR
jgi:septal ring factor EnvC (AmiA/AmiB activator)